MSGCGRLTADCCAAVCCVRAGAAAAAHRPAASQRWCSMVWRLQAVCTLLLARPASLPAPSAAPKWPGAEQISQSPRMWLLPGFVSVSELTEIERGIPHSHACWEGADDPSAAQHTCRLTDWPALENLGVSQLLDRRIAAAFGATLRSIESGYLQRYGAEFEMANLHLDQDPATMSPQRYISILMYLDDMPVGTGHTVFPLATLEPGSGGGSDGVNCSALAHAMLPAGRRTPPRVDAALAAQWEASLSRGLL
jgi:hypothetical protein